MVQDHAFEVIKNKSRMKFKILTYSLTALIPDFLLIFFPTTLQ